MAINEESSHVISEPVSVVEDNPESYTSERGFHFTWLAIILILLPLLLRKVGLLQSFYDYFNLVIVPGKIIARLASYLLRFMFYMTKEVYRLIIWRKREIETSDTRSASAVPYTRHFCRVSHRRYRRTESDGACVVVLLLFLLFVFFISSENN